MIREAVVAGQFYPASPPRLREEIKNLIEEDKRPVKALGAVLPHAGYIYSGEVAGKTVSRLALPDRIVILGPNHTGEGYPFSIMREGTWRTPLGEVEIDSSLSQKILENSSNLQADQVAHRYEHSIEVELPFLQYLNPEIRFVPIVLGGGDATILSEIGRAVAAAIRQREDEVLIVASTDFTHYEAQASAQRKDREAIKAILELNPEKLLKKVRDLNITMCGWAPVAVLLFAARNLGAQKAELVSYQTSGDVSGDYASVVGYAGIIIRG